MLPAKIPRTAWPLLGFAVAAAPAFGGTAFTVCSEPAAAPAFRAGFTAWDDAAVTSAEVPGSPVMARENWRAELAFEAGDRWRIGGAYRGTLLDEKDVGLQTNGYLHSFYFFLERLRTPGNNLRLAVAPALSGSSNVTKDPDEWESDAWQVSLAAVWRWPAGVDDSWRAGLCADHRFGQYRLYPVVAYSWRPHPDWRVEPGFPDATLAWEPGGPIAIALDVYPNGSEWFVKNADLTASSLFEYRAWATELSLTWRPAPAIALRATSGVDVAAEYRARLADGSHATLDAGTVARIGVDVAWYFE